MSNIKDDDYVLVPRGLLGAANYAIKNKKDAPCIIKQFSEIAMTQQGFSAPVDFLRLNACVKACADIRTDALMAMPQSFGKLLSQDFQSIIAQRDELLAALEKYNQAFDALFSRCLSNGVFNAWGGSVDCTTLNEAHKLASTAIAKVKGGAA